jgi:hypothetical protein
LSIAGSVFGAAGGGAPSVGNSSFSTTPGLGANINPSIGSGLNIPFTQ